MIVLVMGVTGSGKTTFAKALAEALGWEFAEGDDLHPPANIARMKAGIPLQDADRIPWLHNVKAWIDDKLIREQSGIITCSALKRAYRDHLGLGRNRIALVHITGQALLIEGRLNRRPAHFMPASLLASQLAILEPPGPDETAISLDAEIATLEQVEMVKRHLSTA